MWKRIATAGVFAIASIAASLPAGAEVNVVIRVAPPAPRFEFVPAPRVGHVWAPGHWAWRDGRHVWVGGHWVRERRGMHWHPSHWVHRDGHWHFVGGGWNHKPYAKRDSDRDGVANRHDRDRDGDGVPNRRDARPDNPNRR